MSQSGADSTAAEEREKGESNKKRPFATIKTDFETMPAQVILLGCRLFTGSISSVERKITGPANPKKLSVSKIKTAQNETKV